MPQSATSTLISYVLCVALFPTVAFWVTFGITCLIECSALPWLSVIAGPGVGVLAVIVSAVVTYRKAAQLEEPTQRWVRIAVLSSVLWGWPVAFFVFGLSLPIAQSLT